MFKNQQNSRFVKSWHYNIIIKILELFYEFILSIGVVKIQLKKWQ